MIGGKSKTRKQKKRYPGPCQCHPRVNDATYTKQAGCFPIDVLKEIAAATGTTWQGSTANMRKRLEKQLGVPTGKERSFLQAAPLPAAKKTQLATRYLRPAQPASWLKDPDRWLDSTNIEQVLQQYEEMNPEFEFMGPFPIDFAAPDPYEKSGRKCLIDEICNFRVQNSMANGKKYIGIVYNLDPHFKSGSHWVANFIDIPRHQCYYFDSYGMEPPPQIQKFMRWLTTHDPQMKLRMNGRRFQYCNTECGMYCIYFIIMMLLGDDFQRLIRREPSDKFMLELRHWIFST